MKLIEVEDQRTATFKQGILAGRLLHKTINHIHIHDAHAKIVSFERHYGFKYSVEQSNPAIDVYGRLTFHDAQGEQPDFWTADQFWAFIPDAFPDARVDLDMQNDFLRHYREDVLAHDHITHTIKPTETVMTGLKTVTAHMRSLFNIISKIT